VFFRDEKPTNSSGTNLNSACAGPQGKLQDEVYNLQGGIHCVPRQSFTARLATGCTNLEAALLDVKTEAI